MWLERIALAITVLGVGVLGLSWFMFSDSWASLEHPQFTENAWYHLGGRIERMQSFPWGTMLTLNITAPVEILAPPNTSMQLHDTIEVIAKQTSLKGKHYLQSLRLIY